MHVQRTKGARTVRINSCIITWCQNLFTPGQARVNGQLTGLRTYRSCFILPADMDQADINLINGIYEEAAGNAHNPGTPRPPSVGPCFQYNQLLARTSPWGDATNGGKQAQFQGRYLLKANARYEDRQGNVVDEKPGVFREDPQLGMIAIESKADVFSGCIVDAIVQFYGRRAPDPGVSCSLIGVLLRQNEGVQRLDNRESAKDAFAATAGAPAPLAQPGPVAPVAPYGQPQQPVESMDDLM